MSTHSPGPWRIDDQDEMLIKSAAGNIVTMVHTGRPADARLVAAAPQMLELLRRLDKLTPQHPPHGECGCVVCDARHLLARLDGDG